MLKRSPLILSSTYIHTIFLKIRLACSPKLSHQPITKIKLYIFKNLVTPCVYPVWSSSYSFACSYLGIKHLRLTKLSWASEWMCQSIAITEASLGNSGGVDRAQPKQLYAIHLIIWALFRTAGQSGQGSGSIKNGLKSWMYHTSEGF